MREFKDLKIAVAGTGYVGLSIATLLSQHHKVTAVDIIPEKVELINNRKNYNMIDGCVNNAPKKPRRIVGRWSVLDRLHIKQAERRQKDNAPQQEQERSRKN